MDQQNPFKWRHYEADIILLCVRWYLRYSLSYRDLEEMMRERRLQVDHTTISRWVQHYAPNWRSAADPISKPPMTPGVSESYHHPVGTCRMGPGTDSMAVVDPQGKVYGVEGLWIVDASIMPTIPAANTNLPTIVVAERCAAWLTTH